MATLVQDLTKARESVKGFPIVLVTGGSGYIGSHTVLQILQTGCAVVVLDSLVNSHVEALTRVYHILQSEYTKTQRDPSTLPPLIFHQLDLRDRKAMARLFHFWQSDDPVEIFNVSTFNILDISTTMKGRDFKMRNYSVAEGDRPPSMPTLPKSEGGRIIAVIHFAALKAVGESVSKPLQYYRNNIGGLLNLLEAMSRFKVNRIVFSSSAVVYGSGKEANISEDSVQVGGKGSGGGLVTNPYGRSKWMAEEILNDYCIANPEFECISLRYFNPTGSHPSGLIGEDPKGIPNNIVPVILQTYQRRRSKVYVYGSNYDTADGTGVRDYIHVEDLARGHLAALRSLLTAPEDRCSVLANGIESEASAETDGENASMSVAENYRVYNLGTGHGYSVLDIINAFAKACGTEIPFAIGEARSGDLGIVTASTQKAATELGWQAQFDIQDMCRDVYTFASENPTGYERLRKLSVLAIQDPSVVRKVSVAAGLVPQTIDKKDISAMIQNYVRASQDAAMFDEMVRSMNVLSPSLDKEFNFDSNSAPGMAAVSGQTGMFGEVAWDEGNMNHASPPPRRDSGVHA